MVRAISIDGQHQHCTGLWPLWSGESPAGFVTSSANSPDFDTHVAIGMVERDFWDAGTTLEVETPEGRAAARVEEKFWI